MKVKKSMRCNKKSAVLRWNVKQSNPFSLLVNSGSSSKECWQNQGSIVSDNN